MCTKVSRAKTRYTIDHVLWLLRWTESLLDEFLETCDHRSLVE